MCVHARMINDYWSDSSRYVCIFDDRFKLYIISNFCIDQYAYQGTEDKDPHKTSPVLLTWGISHDEVIRIGYSMLPFLASWSRSARSFLVGLPRLLGHLHVGYFFCGSGVDADCWVQLLFSQAHFHGDCKALHNFTRMWSSVMQA